MGKACGACNRCKKSSHLYADHNEDSLLPADVMSFDILVSSNCDTSVAQLSLHKLQVLPLMGFNPLVLKNRQTIFVIYMFNVVDDIQAD